MTVEPTAANPEPTADALVGRLFEAGIGMFTIMSVYLGDRLGLYRTLDEGGPATAADLATRAGIDQRYAREWLEQQAVADILAVDSVDAAAEARRYSLPEAYAEPLLNPDSPYSIAPLGRSIVACAKVLPELMEAYRTGGGVAWSDYGPDMIEAQGDFNRPWLRGSFGTELLPAIPETIGGSRRTRLRGSPTSRAAWAGPRSRWHSPIQP